MSMYTLLNADFLISLVLSRFGQASFPDIVKIRDKIQKNESDIIIDLSGNAVNQAMYLYSSYYKLDGNRVKRVCPRGAYINDDFIEKEFSQEVSKNVLERVQKYVREASISDQGNGFNCAAQNI